MLRPLVVSLSLLFAAGPALAADWSLVNVVETRADTPDATPVRHGQGGANINRFGFYSDLAFDPRTFSWYALSDRGPGGGVIDYATRLQHLRIPFHPFSGRIGQPRVERTVVFQDKAGQPFDGINPRLLNGSAAVLGNSFDPEGLAIGRNGHFYVSDEYGPSLYEFDRRGRFVRAFSIPDNLVAREATGAANYVDGRPTIVHGRQDNRGFEGLTFNASGDRLYAVMQDPLVDEGSSNDGRRSRNVRIVEFDPRSGTSSAQYVYQLESTAALNSVNAGTEDDFSATQQGRSIGLSAIVAISDREFLVLERDNRGLGVDVTAAPLHKRVYRIDLRGATNVQTLSLAGSDALPAGVVAVGKAPEVDLLATLVQQGLTVPEKIEGLAIGPRLLNGRHLVLVGTDNDYSVTQTGAGEQFDVCVNRTDGSRRQVPLDTPCPAGSALIPGMLMSFTADLRRSGR
jgi:hypothetical protein